MPTRPSSKPDSDLLEAAAGGDEGAFGELVCRHRRSVLATARRVVRDRTLAEEIVQEVFLDLWQRPEHFDAGRGTIGGYLMTKVRSRSIDCVRSEHARRHRERRQAAERRTLAAAPGEARFEVDDFRALHTAVAALEDRLRVPIELAYSHGLTYREVALRLREPEGTIKSRIRSGLALLRKEMPGSARWLLAA